jgi:hypothetical protein
MLPCSIDLENGYVCGLTHIKEFFVICQFQMPLAAPAEQSLQNGILNAITSSAKKTREDTSESRHQDEPDQKTPELCIYRGQNECLMQDKLP